MRSLHIIFIISPTLHFVNQISKIRVFVQIGDLLCSLSLAAFENILGQTLLFHNLDSEPIQKGSERHLLITQRLLFLPLNVSYLTHLAEHPD